ncbi:hypothetical protein AABB24_007417, partial [Solanum stoloniferum]
SIPIHPIPSPSKQYSNKTTRAIPNDPCVCFFFTRKSQQIRREVREIVQTLQQSADPPFQKFSIPFTVALKKKEKKFEFQNSKLYPFPPNFHLYNHLFRSLFKGEEKRKIELEEVGKKVLRVERD